MTRARAGPGRGGAPGNAFPPVEELLPQSGRMRLVSEVLAHDAGATSCAVDVGRSELFRDAEGRVPVWVALEYMAQCAAVHGGLLSRRLGEPMRPGLFVSARRVAFHAEAFDPGAPLVVTARHERGERGLVGFDCEVRAADGAPLAAGRLFVYVADDWSQLAEVAP